MRTIIYFLLCKRIRDAAFFLIIMFVTFAATLLKPQNYVSSRTIQKCVEHVSTSTYKHPKKYVNINGKVSKDKWQSMFRYFAKYV